MTATIDPADRLASLLSLRASPSGPSAEAPVSPEGHGRPPQGPAGRPEPDQRTEPTAEAVSTVRAENLTPRPQVNPTSGSPAAPARLELGAGDIVVAVLAGRPTLCAVQRVRRADAVAIVRPLDQLDRYDRVPAVELRRVAAHDAIVRWAGL